MKCINYRTYEHGEVLKMSNQWNLVFFHYVCDFVDFFSHQRLEHILYPYWRTGEVSYKTFPQK